MQVNIDSVWKLKYADVSISAEIPAPLVGSCPPIANKIYHGTGCTLSTAIACNIDPKKDIDKSIQTALKYMKKVITASTINGKKQSFLNRNFWWEAYMRF